MNNNQRGKGPLSNLPARQAGKNATKQKSTLYTWSEKFDTDFDNMFAKRSAENTQEVLNAKLKWHYKVPESPENKAESSNASKSSSDTKDVKPIETITKDLKPIETKIKPSSSTASDDGYTPTSPSSTPDASPKSSLSDDDYTKWSDIKKVYVALQCRFKLQDLITFEMQKCNIPGYEVPKEDFNLLR